MAADRRTVPLTDLTVEQQGRGKDRPAWKVIGEKRRRHGNIERGATDETGLSFQHRQGGRRHAAESPRRRAFGAKQAEARAQHLRRVEIDHRQHRSEAIAKLDHRRTVDGGSSAVGDRFVVAAFDFDREVEHGAGRDIAVKDRFGSERRDGSTAKIDLVHRRPRRELSHRFGDETGRKRGQVAGHGEAPASASACLERRDAIDERERREVVAHAVSNLFSSPVEPRAERAPRACRTSRA
jgi:hypothetical protein